MWRVAVRQHLHESCVLIVLKQHLQAIAHKCPSRERERERKREREKKREKDGHTKAQIKINTMGQKLSKKGGVKEN